MLLSDVPSALGPFQYVLVPKGRPLIESEQQKRAGSRVRNTGCQRLEAEPVGHDRVAGVGRAPAGAPLDVRLRILFAHIVFRFQARIEVVESKLRLNRVTSESQNQEHPFHCQISYGQGEAIYEADRALQEHAILSRVESRSAAEVGDLSHEITSLAAGHQH
jgi:hypothetical protein